MNQSTLSLIGNSLVIAHDLACVGPIPLTHCAHMTVHQALIWVVQEFVIELIHLLLLRYSIDLGHLGLLLVLYCDVSHFGLAIDAVLMADLIISEWVFDQAAELRSHLLLQLFSVITYRFYPVSRCLNDLKIILVDIGILTGSHRLLTLTLFLCLVNFFVRLLYLFPHVIDNQLLLEWARCPLLLLLRSNIDSIRKICLPLNIQQQVGLFASFSFRFHRNSCRLNGASEGLVGIPIERGRVSW